MHTNLIELNSERTKSTLPVTITIIDDDAVTIFLAKKTLRNFDHALEINHYTSGKEAYHKLALEGARQPLIILIRLMALFVNNMEEHLILDWVAN